MSMLAAVHCGANFILHSAGFLDGLLSMSYEKFVMDADFCGALHTYLDGVQDRRQPAGARRLPRGRAGQPFLRLRAYDGELRDRLLGLARSPTTSRSRNGRRPARRTPPIRANRRWKKALAEYQAPPLDEAIDEGSGFHGAKGGDGRRVVLRPLMKITDVRVTHVNVRWMRRSGGRPVSMAARRSRSSRWRPTRARGSAKRHGGISAR